MLDTGKTVTSIQVRVFKDRKETFVTGMRFLDSASQIAGVVELHDYGDWESFAVEDGYQIVGVHGLSNNLIRGLGFILFNRNAEDD